MTSRILGLERVRRRLEMEVRRIRGGTLRGLILAAAHIRQKIDTVPPMVPVDTGNLRLSWFAEPGVTSVGPIVRIGHSANYALFVHEKLGARFQRPGAGPKWLQSHLWNSKDEILRILADSVRG